MFSVSKKSILLSIIFFTMLHIQCFAKPQTIAITSGQITFNSDDKQSENSPLWKLGKIFLPIVGGALINYVFQKWNEDPETVALNKEEKKIELAIKQHPDYVDIETLHKKNQEKEIQLNLKQKKLELKGIKASIIQHHQEQWAEYKKCNAPFTHDFCNDMIKIHEAELSKYMKNR